MKTCKCGCGREVISPDKEGRLRSYVHGHHSKTIPWNKGKKLGPLSAERRRKIGDGNRGKIVSEEARVKISNSLKGHKNSPEAYAKTAAWHRGRKRTDETRRKLSEAHRGRIMPEEQKKKISLSNIGKHVLSDEAKKRIGDASKARRPFKIIRVHLVKRQTSVSKEVKMCKCGCGREVISPDKKGRPVDYVQYHGGFPKGHTVTEKMRTRCVSNQRYKIDEYCFDVVKTELQAYVLGLLLSDGCVKKGTVTQLGLVDKELVEKVGRLFYPEGDRPLYHRKRFGNQKDLYTLQVCNRKVAQRLIALGVVSRKTFKVTFPEWLDATLHHHFIRGYFDGDGCITFSKNKGVSLSPVFSLVGTEELLLRVQGILMSECGLGRTRFYERHPERKTNIRSFCYGGTHNVIKIRDYLYKDATIFLDRKHAKMYSVKAKQWVCRMCNKECVATSNNNKAIPITCSSKLCQRKNSDEWRKKNQQHIIEYRRRRYQNQKDKTEFKERQRQYRQQNKARIKEHNHKYYLRNKALRDIAVIDIKQSDISEAPK